MKRLTRIFPLLLAAALQVLPLLRNIVTNPAASSSFAIILRWGIGAGATLSAVNAVSGASAPSYTSPTNFVGTVGTFFTNNITLSATGTDGNAVASITSNSVTVNLTVAGQATNFAMPAGLNFKFIDNKSLANGVYDSISGTPTNTSTNSFTVTMSYAGTIFTSTNITIRILAASSIAPVITNQPASRTNNVGTTANFTVTNGGTAPLSYQWYFNTNTALLNQTNPSLAFASVQLTNAGNYSVIITNSAGSVTSSYALLTVWQPPVITNQPTSITTVAGGNGTFNILAGGVPTPAYQWNFNTNTALPNATNTSLSLTGLRAIQAGVYTVVITNSAGNVTSSIANLIITNPNPPTMSGPVKNGSLFQFTFVPVVGLTNSVLTNSVISGGSWGVLTNVPPPSTVSPITITDPFSKTNRFYRVQIVP